MVTQMMIAHLVLEQYERAHELAGALREEGRQRGSLLATLNASAYAGALHSREGDLDTAEADIRLAVDMIASAPLGMVGAIALFCFAVDAITERRGLADVADVILATEIPPDFASTATGALVNELKAAIHVSRGDREAAIERLRAAGATWTPIGVGPRTSGWRSHLAVLLDETSWEESLELVEDELAAARRLESRRCTGIALRALGTILGGERGLEALTESVSELRGSASRLELARSLALGAAMRRERRIRDARVHLREALELAQETGAELLEAHVFEELRVAGARPRRREIRGVGALTPAELRVAEAAAQGATNREIAQDLFVSLRTIEMHLTNAYRKLGITSRDELAAAISS
jgi:DNA-binding CsgD family transcriptional regulator